MKIGRAVSVGLRLEQLQACSPVPLEIVGEWRVPNMQAAEAYLHRFFADVWHHGEWFSIDDVAAVEDAIGLILDSSRTTLNPWLFRDSGGSTLTTPLGTEARR